MTTTRRRSDVSIVDRKLTKLPAWRLRIIEQVEREAAERAARESHRARQAAKKAEETK